MSTSLAPALQRYVDAVNAFDLDAVVNDNNREFADPQSIRRWVPDELILTNYVVVRDDLITGLFIIFNN